MTGDIPEWTTESLLAIRENLLRGLDIVAVHVENGTLDTKPAGPKNDKTNPPRAGGQLTLMLLTRVNNELFERGFAPKW